MHFIFLEIYAPQIKDNNARFLLVDADTLPVMRESAALVSWPVEYISVGNTSLPGTMSFKEMLKDDGSGTICLEL